MRCTDFQYDGINLRDMGFMICAFDFSNTIKSQVGSLIEMTTAANSTGTQHSLLASGYKETLGTTFQICKNLCNGEFLSIKQSELYDLARWLSRNEYHKMKFLDPDDGIDLYYEATFDLQAIEIYGETVGVELSMKTNRPFALKEEELVRIRATQAGDEKAFYDESNVEGYIYPSMVITVKEAGNLEITNLYNNRKMVVKNCSADEVITVNYPVIQSSDLEHNINNDFNWVFFRIENSFGNTLNTVKVSLPCNIDITYSPQIKIAV